MGEPGGLVARYVDTVLILRVSPFSVKFGSFRTTTPISNSGYESYSQDPQGGEIHHRGGTDEYRSRGQDCHCELLHSLHCFFLRELFDGVALCWKWRERSYVVPKYAMCPLCCKHSCQCAHTMFVQHISDERSFASPTNITL